MLILEEQMRAKKFSKEAYCKSKSEDNQSLKTIKSWLPKSEVTQSLKSRT